VGTIGTNSLPMYGSACKNYLHALEQTPFELISGRNDRHN
jgi:hypothetical protein